MKTIKTALFFFSLLWTLNSFAQTKELVYIRIQEKINNIPWDSYMRITYPNKPSKLVELTKLGVGGKGSEENGKTIHNELTSLTHDGYEIVSCSVGADQNASTTIIILSKQKD